MVCNTCGDAVHNARTCPLLQDADRNASQVDGLKRVSRDSPGTPVNTDAKMAKLREMSAKISPKARVPPLPFERSQEAGASGSAGGGSGTDAGMEEAPTSTDQKLDKLMAMMTKVAVKDDLEEMKRSLLKDVEVNTKVAISEAVDPIKNKIADIEQNMGLIQGLERSVKEMQQTTVTKTEVQAMIAEAVTSKLNFSSAPGDAAHALNSNTAIVGGLDGLGSLEEAESWLKAELATIKAPNPLGVFIKGDEYKGIVFAKFPGPSSLDPALTLMRKKKNLTFKGKKVWANVDRPIAIRAPFKLLLAIQKMLVVWDLGFKKKLQVDDNEMVLKFSNVPILSAVCVDGAVKLTLLSAEWEAWEELLQDPSSLEIMSTCNDALAKAQEMQGKGGGKGNGP